MIQGYGTRVHIQTLFQYQIYETENNEQPLQLLAHDVILYSKYLNANRFVNPKSFSFVYNDISTESQEIHLVLLSTTFTVSLIPGTNMYVLCSANIPTHRFILRFPQRESARHFNKFIKNDLNGEIDCEIRWVTFDLLRDINSQ